MASRSKTTPAAASSILSWPLLSAFVAGTERLGLHGLPFQHVALCGRRAWFHLKKIDCAHLDERMALGATLHDLSQVRDQSVAGLMGLAPDRIDWAERLVVEAKGGAGAVEAVSDQTAFYAVLLAAATKAEWRAATHLIRSKRMRPVTIDAVRLDRLWRALERLEALAAARTPPSAERIPLCPACSYRHLCFG